MTHQDEQKILFKNYLETHVLSNWKYGVKEYKGNPNDLRQKENFISTASGFGTPLELIISKVCNTKCSYCYYKNFGELLYPKELEDRNLILENCEKLLKWVNLNDYHPANIDIFSGEFFNLPYYKDIIDLIVKYVKPVNASTPVYISIPSNCTFCFSDEKTAEIQELVDTYNKKDSQYRIGVSMSIDGKYLDNDTRALRNGKKYDDEYYDRAFKFAAKNNFAFHPMLGAKGMDRWIDNWEWYISNIVKYFECDEIEAFKRIYLLEVRNPDWTPREMQFLDDFITHYTQRAFELCHRNTRMFADVFLHGHGGNLYSEVASSIPRGLGCSIQSNLGVRLGDLAIPLCHRTSYDGYIAGRLKLDGASWDVELENPNVWMLVNSFHSSNTVKCCDCPISEICNKFCIGCNFEVNKDFFVPVDTVCDMELVKTISLIRNLDNIGVLDLLIRTLEGDAGSNRLRAQQIKAMKAFIKSQDKENIRK